MLVLDTATLPEGDRADAYHAVASGEIGSCGVEQERAGGALWKRLEVWNLGPVTLFATRGSGMRIWRTMRHARHDSMHTVSIITQPVGTGRFGWHGFQQHVTPGMLSLAHKTSSYEYGWSGSGLSVAFAVDVDELGLSAATVRAAIPLLNESRVAPLLAQHLQAVHRDADRLSAEAGAADVGESMLALTRAVVASVSADDRARRDIAQETLFTRILTYVRAHLADPHLTPQRIAAVHNVSPRTLYRLCEANGLSLEQWIIRRRLEGARRDLAAPEHAHRSIESVGRSWGFTSPTYFSRRFRQAYSVTPREWRRSQGDGSARHTL